MALLRHKALRKLLIIFVFIGAVALALFFDQYLYADSPLENETIVVIPKGSSLSRASEILMYHGVVSFDGHMLGLFKLSYYLTNYGHPIKAGEYSFRAGISPHEILNKLTTGDMHYRKITIPEGLTTHETLSLIAEADGLTGLVPEGINEGELLPETYLYSYGEKRKDLVKRIYTKHYQLLEKLWELRESDLPIKTKEEALILASIIEKETGISGERGTVASVYTNRLRKNMRLQADPTVVYGITMGKKDLGRELSRKDLKHDSKYNTYKYKGLPPGPICNPGEEALRAALAPSETDFIYFVADGSGGHNFAKTLDQHNRNVRLYRIFKRKSL